MNACRRSHLFVLEPVLASQICPAAPLALSLSTASSEPPL